MVGNFDFLKGNIETIILNALYGGDKYGYDITREIKEKTDNQYEIKQPTLYGYLKKLEAEKLIESYWGGESNGGRRKYYKLTQKGRELCIEYKSEWKFHKNVMESLVDSESDDQLPEKNQSEVSTIFGRKSNAKKPRAENIVTKEELNRVNELLSAKPHSPSVNENNKNSDEEKAAAALTSTVAEQQKPQDTKQNIVSSAEPAKQKVSYFAQIEKQETQQEKEYKSILDNLVGEQLTAKEKRAAEFKNISREQDAPTPFSVPTSPDEVNHLQLSETADAMAKQGLRMKLYNRVASVYKPAPFLPVNKLNFLTALFGFVFVAIEMIVFWLCVRNKTYGKSAPFLIVLGAALLIMVAFLFVWLRWPTKKVKPRFHQKFHIINSLIFFVIAGVAVLVVDLLILNLAFNDEQAVVMSLVFPIMVLLNAPVYVLINSFLRSEYLKKL